MEERVIRLHECFSRTGGICLPALLSKSHHDSVLGVGAVGCGSRAKTLYFPYTITDVDSRGTTNQQKNINS